MDLNPSPTGRPKLPPRVVPWLQLLYPISVAISAAFALPGPWTTERYFLVATNALGTILGMASAGNRGRAAPLLLALLFVPLAAQAGSPRYHSHTFTVSTAACPTGTPGTDTDGQPYGISLSGVRAWTVEICPVTTGAYFTGAGLLKTCTFSQTEWGSGGWALGPDLDSGTEDLTSTADNPCRRFWDVEVGVGLSDRVYVYPSTDLGLSAGTQVRVRVFGETR